MMAMVESEKISGAKSCDAIGNIGTSGPKTFGVDTVAPTVAASATNADGTTYTAGAWTRQSVTVHYTCADSGSGVASCTADQVFAG